MKYMLFLLITVLSCNSKSPVKPVKSYLFDMEETKVSYKAKDLFKSMDFIKLETGEDFLLSDITKIEIDADKIFIQDSDKKNIFVFDTTGRHLTNLVSIGKGPGELVSAYYFAIDKLNDHVYVSDPWSQIMIKYSYDGIILKENRGISSSGGLGILNGILIADISEKNLPRLDEHRDKSDFIKYNFEADSLWSLNVTGNYYHNNDIAFQAHHRFLNLNNDLFFLDEIGGNVMEFNGDTLSVKYKIDFGKNDMGYQRIKRFSKKMGDFFSYMRKKSFAFITDLHETNNFIFLEIYYNKLGLHGVIDKKNDSILIYASLNPIDFNYPCNPIIIGANDDEFIGFVRPSDVVESKKILGEEYQKLVEKYSLQDVKEDDNPIIVLLKFKSAPKTRPLNMMEETEEQTTYSVTLQDLALGNGETDGETGGGTGGGGADGETGGGTGGGGTTGGGCTCENNPGTYYKGYHNHTKIIRNFSGSISSYMRRNFILPAGLSITVGASGSLTYCRRSFILFFWEKCYKNLRGCL